MQVACFDGRTTFLGHFAKYCPRKNKMEVYFIASLITINKL